MTEAIQESKAASYSTDSRERSECTPMAILAAAAPLFEDLVARDYTATDTVNNGPSIPEREDEVGEDEDEEDQCIEHEEKTRRPVKRKTQCDLCQPQ